MSNCIIVLVTAPSPMLGRSPFSTSNFMGGRKSEKYITILNSELERVNSSWTAKKDESESDIVKISEDASLIICIPGLKYQFYTKGFSKNKIIHLTTMQYETFDTSVVHNKIKELSL